MCVGLVIVGFVTGIEQQLDASVELLGTASDPVTEVGELGFTLLALYLAAPASTVQNLGHTPVSNVEPAFSAAEKDVTV
ncbi:hypothetical protein D3C79_1017540 [compost metagenome]